MIGLVVVSHSRPLAEAAVALAAQMLPGAGPAVEIAAGMPDGTLGTDATAVADAIARADGPDGVLVFVDLGSAILSSHLALEFLEPDVAARTHLTAAPLVEGLFAAYVTASTGADLATVRREAEGAPDAKRAQLDAD